MKTVTIWTLACAILIVVGLFAMARHAKTSQPSSLLGAWTLRSVGGKDPATIGIKSWRIEFQDQGKLLYSGEMTAEYEGMKLGSSGTWLLRGSKLDYTVGVNKGTSTVLLERGSLTLSPDPMVRLQAEGLVNTQYVRLVSR